MPALPHWLQIDPLASVQRLLQGYATGAQIGESLRAGEQHAADAADTNARFESELAHREANAQREYQLHAQLQQEKAEVAARSLAGMQEYQQLVASGMPKEQALMRAAPNLFYKQPDKLMNALHEFQLEKQAQENAARMAKSQETTDQFRQAQVNHWETTAAETKRANQEREKRLTESATKPKFFHVGNSVVQVDANGDAIPIFQAQGMEKLNPVEGKEVSALFAQQSKLQNALTDAITQKQRASIQEQLQKVNESIDKFRQRFNPPPPESKGYLPKSGMGDLHAAERDMTPELPAKATPTSTTGAERVRVRSKAGVIGNIPKSQLEAALKAGYSLVE